MCHAFREATSSVHGQLSRAGQASLDRTKLTGSSLARTQAMQRTAGETFLTHPGGTLINLHLLFSLMAGSQLLWQKITCSPQRTRRAGRGRSRRALRRPGLPRSAPIPLLTTKILLYQRCCCLAEATTKAQETQYTWQCLTLCIASTVGLDCRPLVTDFTGRKVSTCSFQVAAALH